MTDKDDFGFTTVSRPLNGTITHENIERVLNKVNAFLDKLAENPDKDIHWPNRDVRIQVFKKELQDILYGKF